MNKTATSTSQASPNQACKVPVQHYIVRQPKGKPSIPANKATIGRM